MVSDRPARRIEPTYDLPCGPLLFAAKAHVAPDVPQEFDLRAYFGDASAVFRGDPSYDVELHFDARAGAVVSETTWHHTQESRRHEDGSVTLSFRVDGLEEIVWWVLGWSGFVEVVRPLELRLLVVEKLRRAMAMNPLPDPQSKGSGRSKNRRAR